MAARPVKAAASDEEEALLAFVKSQFRLQLDDFVQGAKPQSPTSLQDDRARLYFYRFLALEYNTENFHFVQAATLYKDLPAFGAMRRHAADDIVRQFFSDGADEELNISAALRKTTVSAAQLKVGVPGANVFDSARQAVMDMLLRDSFPRFLRSREFVEYKTEVTRAVLTQASASVDH